MKFSYLQFLAKHGFFFDKSFAVQFSHNHTDSYMYGDAPYTLTPCVPKNKKKFLEFFDNLSTSVYNVCVFKVTMAYQEFVVANSAGRKAIDAGLYKNLSIEQSAIDRYNAEIVFYKDSKPVFSVDDDKTDLNIINIIHSLAFPRVVDIDFLVRDANSIAEVYNKTSRTEIVKDALSIAETLLAKKVNVVEIKVNGEVVSLGTLESSLHAGLLKYKESFVSISYKNGETAYIKLIRAGMEFGRL